MNNFFGKATALLMSCAVSFTSVDVSAFSTNLLNTIGITTQAATKSETDIIEVKELETFVDEVSILSESDNLDVDSTYATQRLIVVSDTADFDNFNASSVVCYDNIYILSYDTRTACKKAYQGLQDNQTIKSVEVDSVMETENATVATDTVTTETKTELKTFLDSLTPATDVKVAILDTGIDVSNQLFENRFIDLGINLSSSGEANSVSDDNGHGTEMATIIATNSNEHVKLMPIKVANSDGKATVLNTYLGIQQAVENNADVINISMTAAKSATSEILTDAINTATEKGIIVVVSAGNNAGDTNNYAPANIESAIVVSAVDAENVFADYSNHGTTVDYAACGVYNDKTGTSYAAANVTGMIADVLSKNQTLDKLNEYAIDLGDTGVDVYYGNGYLGYTMCTQSDDKDDCNDDDCNTDDSNKTVGSAVNSLGNNYVLVGDTSFDITQDFSHIDYNSDAYTARYVSSSPEFDVNKTGTYSVTYEFVDKNDENYVETCIRDVTVTDDKEFIDSFESLAVSETYSTVEVSNNVRYTAWTSYTGGESKQFNSSSTLQKSNARMSVILTGLKGLRNKVTAKDSDVTFVDIARYGGYLAGNDDFKDYSSAPTSLGRWQYLLLYQGWDETTGSNATYFGVTGGTLKGTDYFSQLLNAVNALHNANIATSDIVNKDWSKLTTTEQGCLGSKFLFDLYCRIEAAYGDAMFNAPTDIIKGHGPTGYGADYTDVATYASLASYGDDQFKEFSSRITKSFSDVSTSVSNLSNISSVTSLGLNAVCIAQNVKVYKGSTLNFTLYGGSCGHAGSLGAVIACDSNGNVVKQRALSVGKGTGSGKASPEFIFSEAATLNFYAVGVAYACPFAETYITATGNYSLTVPTYKISLVDRLNNTSGAYYEKYGYGNYDSDAAKANLITKVTPPSKDGYIFVGYYYTDTDGTEKQCVDANGNILSTATTFTCDKQAFAKWIPITSKLVVYPDSPDAVSLKPEWAATWNGSSDKQELEGKYTESIEIPLPQKIGYTFVKWLSNPDTLNGTLSSFTVAATYAYGTVKDAIDTITAMWKANDDTKYVVKHHLQDLNYNSVTYTLADEQPLTGTTDEWLNVDDLQKSYEHFTYDHGEVDGVVTDKAQILPDGSLEINLYYTRDKYKIETKSEGSGSIDATITGIFYGDTKTISYKPAEDCYLQYLVVDGTKITGKDLNAYLESYEFANISKDHEIKAVFKAIPQITVTTEMASRLKNVDVPWDMVSLIKITGTDYLGNEYTYYRSIEGAGSVTLKVPAGTYTVSQLDVDRWKQTAVTGVTHCTVSGSNGVCDTSDYDASVKFTNDIADWSEYSDNDVDVQ